jgi:polyhydroxybutyrate depolymerase
MKWKVDDVGFIARLLDELPEQYAVDQTRVYSTGMSNGAAMSYRLACELPDRIAAICAVASTMGVDGPKPKRPVPIMQIQGMKDPVAPFAGGVGAKSIPPVHRKAVRDVIQWWCAVDHCSPKPSNVVRTVDYVMEQYEPPRGEPGAPVVLYMLLEGGHTWPGGVDVTSLLGTGKLIDTFDADATMWEFFRHFSIPGAGRR